MKNIFKELNPLGLRLSLIAGVNWLISKVIKLLYLMVLIVTSAILIKESTTSLKVDPEPFGILMILILLVSPLLDIRKGVQTVISNLFYVRPFGEKDELDFHLVHFDISRKDAFTVTGQSLLKRKE